MIKIDNPPYVPSPNMYKGRQGQQVQLIVIHSMESEERLDTAENIAKGWFARKQSRASAHYCVDGDSIVQCVYDSDTAWHCKNANRNGIGIEHAGRANQTAEQWLDDYGKAMLDLSARLGAYLCDKFSIAPIRAVFKSPSNPAVIVPGFCGHYDVPSHGSHHDPYRELRSADGKTVIAYDRNSFPWIHYLSTVQHYLKNGWS